MHVCESRGFRWVCLFVLMGYVVSGLESDVFPRSFETQLHREIVQEQLFLSNVSSSYRGTAWSDYVGSVSFDGTPLDLIFDTGSSSVAIAARSPGRADQCPVVYPEWTACEAGEPTGVQYGSGHWDGKVCNVKDVHFGGTNIIGDTLKKENGFLVGGIISQLNMLQCTSANHTQSVSSHDCETDMSLYPTQSSYRHKTQAGILGLSYPSLVTTSAISEVVSIERAKVLESIPPHLRPFPGSKVDNVLATMAEQAAKKGLFQERRIDPQTVTFIHGQNGSITHGVPPLQHSPVYTPVLDPRFFEIALMDVEVVFEDNVTISLYQQLADPTQSLLTGTNIQDILKRTQLSQVYVTSKLEMKRNSTLSLETRKSKRGTFTEYQEQAVQSKKGHRKHGKYTKYLEMQKNKPSVLPPVQSLPNTHLGFRALIDTGTGPLALLPDLFALAIWVIEHGTGVTLPSAFWNGSMCLPLELATNRTVHGKQNPQRSEYVREDVVADKIVFPSLRLRLLRDVQDNIQDHCSNMAAVAVQRQVLSLEALYLEGVRNLKDATLDSTQPFEANLASLVRNKMVHVLKSKNHGDIPWKSILQHLTESELQQLGKIAYSYCMGNYEGHTIHAKTHSSSSVFNKTGIFWNNEVPILELLNTTHYLLTIQKVTVLVRDDTLQHMETVLTHPSETEERELASILHESTHLYKLPAWPNLTLPTFTIDIPPSQYIPSTPAAHCPNPYNRSPLFGETRKVPNTCYAFPLTPSTVYPFTFANGGNYCMLTAYEDVNLIGITAMEEYTTIFEPTKGRVGFSPLQTTTHVQPAEMLQDKRNKNIYRLSRKTPNDMTTPKLQQLTITDDEDHTYTTTSSYLDSVQDNYIPIFIIAIVVIAILLYLPIRTYFLTYVARRQGYDPISYP